MAESQVSVAPLGRPPGMRAPLPRLKSSRIAPARESVTVSETPRSVKVSRCHRFGSVCGAFVIQIRAQPSFDSAQFHTLAPLVIEHLIAPDLAHCEVTRPGVGEIQTANRSSR